ncbi:MAG: polyhydroxyalkanoic acid system family protein [Burkholderiaceae bacterium]|nr:polyhydroxyalkanoic acid system family protein [Burkholderiaceae bacterium]
MAELRIRREHGLGLPEARKAAQRVADELAGAFQMTSAWDGDILRFSRSGVEGALSVTADHVEVVARLGMLVAMLKPQIEARVKRDFDEHFGSV